MTVLGVNSSSWSCSLVYHCSDAKSHQEQLVLLSKQEDGALESKIDDFIGRTYEWSPPTLAQ